MIDYYSTKNQLSARKDNFYSEIVSSLEKCPFCDLKKKYLIKRLAGMYLTVNLFPYTTGHLLIVSQRHLENINQLTKKEAKAVFELLKLGQKLLKNRLQINDFAIVFHQGDKAGRSLRHFHISIIPDAKAVLKKEYQEVTIAPLALASLLRKGL